MPLQVDEAAPPTTRGVWHDRWIAELHAPRAAQTDPREQTWKARSGTIAFSVRGVAGSDLTIAEDSNRVVLFAGILTNARELRDNRVAATPAAMVLDEFATLGAEAFNRLRGPFAILVWEKDSGQLLAARDHVGMAPHFYARAEHRWLFSSSPDALVAEPGVSGEIDAVVLSEWLCGWFPVLEDTAYRAVKRVPAATVVTFASGAASSRRYWEPVPEDQPIEWLTESELAEFDSHLWRAVERTIGGSDGPAAVFLSGGLDSIAVALKATDVARATGHLDPIALSLVFPHGESNEAPIQTGVARQLGIPQHLVPFDDAVGPQGLIEAALALSASWPQPMWNAWAPGYMRLAALGASQGARVVLTGRGGDEWLTITPYLLADHLRRGDLAGAWRLIQMRRRSNNLRGARAIANLLWLTAGRPLLSAGLDAIAPKRWHQSRRNRLLSERPDWIAPDPAIRAAMDERVEGWIAPARPKQGFYARTARSALTHPAVMQDLEETQELGRRHGQRMLHPFWDVDLLTMLFRTKPADLIRDGQFKWLLRRVVVPRLPGLGLDSRGKVSAENVFLGIVSREMGAAWQGRGGLSTLAGLGVVNPAGVQWNGSGFGGIHSPSRLWSLLNFESWVRPRSYSSNR